MALLRTSPQPPAPHATKASRARALVRGIGVVVLGPLVALTGSAVAPVAAARRWPDRLGSSRRKSAGWAVTGAALVTPWVYALGVRPWFQRWGSTETERAAVYPGDVPDPLSTTTRAVTIQAPAEEVWAWLVQIGADRGGFYSYDWLENLAGCRLHSADRIHAEWQQRRAGDPLYLMPGASTALESVDPPRSLVIENWGAYVVEPIDASSCRLIARSHADRNAVGVAYTALIELPHAIMERKMLLGIKKRAEAAGIARPHGGIPQL